MAVKQIWLIFINLDRQVMENFWPHIREMTSEHLICNNHAGLCYRSMMDVGKKNYLYFLISNLTNPYEIFLSSPEVRNLVMINDNDK